MYKWPSDPLHTWSRLWEYPYVYHHVQRALEQSGDKTLRVLDFGSGVTFFPFALAQLGCEVRCADIDPICAVDIPKAAKLVQHEPGSVGVALIEKGRIPVESNSQDVVYCISVLEHIADFEAVIDEMARVLQPRGKLILTVDIDLRGNAELGVDEYQRLLLKLEEYFVRRLPERPVHPSDLLTTSNSPYRVPNHSFLSTTKQLIKSALAGKVPNGGPRVGIYLGIYSAVLERR